MRQETWNLLDEMFEKYPVMKGSGVNYEIIDALCRRFNVKIPESYREFIRRYGSATVGEFNIFGIGVSETMGGEESSVFEVTRNFNEGNWPGIEGWLIISMDHAGNPVGLTVDGEVWISDSVHGCIDKLADDFEGYILEWCLDAE